MSRLSSSSSPWAGGCVWGRPGILANWFRRVPSGSAGASLDGYGYGQRGEGQRWCPCAPRSGLPERRSVDAATGIGEGGGREGGGPGRRVDVSAAARAGLQPAAS